MRSSECDQDGSGFAMRDARGMAGYPDSVQEWIRMLDSPLDNRQQVSGSCDNAFLGKGRQS